MILMPPVDNGNTGGGTGDPTQQMPPAPQPGDGGQAPVTDAPGAPMDNPMGTPEPAPTGTPEPTGAPEPTTGGGEPGAGVPPTA